MGRMPTENGLPQYVSKDAKTGNYQYFRRPPKTVAGAAFTRSFGTKDTVRVFLPIPNALICFRLIPPSLGI